MTLRHNRMLGNSWNLLLLSAPPRQESPAADFPRKRPFLLSIALADFYFRAKPRFRSWRKRLITDILSERQHTGLNVIWSLCGFGKIILFPKTCGAVYSWFSQVRRAHGLQIGHRRYANLRKRSCLLTTFPNRQLKADLYKTSKMKEF